MRRALTSKMVPPTGGQAVWKENVFTHIFFFHLPHDGYYKGADDYVLCSQVFLFLVVYVWGHSACIREII